MKSKIITPIYDNHSNFAKNFITGYDKLMAKRGTTLSPKKKSRRSHKTRKRLEVKRAMLAKKAARKKF